MEYVIAFGVAAMMGLYVLIIARWLREPEWQVNLSTANSEWL